MELKIVFKKGFDKMNRNDLEVFIESIDFELDKIKNNEAYINNKSYFGLDKELLSYIRKLEQALDEIENILNGVGEMACYSKSMYLDGEDIEDILEIIKKAKRK